MKSDKNSNIFKDLIQGDNLSHAYLFYGEAKDEMKQQALGLAKALENASLESTTTLIDADIIDAQEKNSLGIDLVREIKNFLSQKPIKSKKRTAIILGAEELTREAQNAILKILEDAPPSALIILVATTPERLLPTIVSRLQKVYMASEQGAKISKKADAGDHARQLADKFLRSDAALRRAMAKEIVDEENEGSSNLAVAFLDELIKLLSEKPEANYILLKEILARRRLLGDYSLNKRLQLAYLSSLFYNGRVQ